jgi:hypothetical protein
MQFLQHVFYSTECICADLLFPLAITLDGWTCGAYAMTPHQECHVHYTAYTLDRVTRVSAT